MYMYVCVYIYIYIRNRLSLEQKRPFHPLYATA